MAAPISYGLGIFFLTLYILAGVVFSQVVQLTGTGQEGKYSKPYFESYLYHSIWVVVVPMALAVYHIEKRLFLRRNPLATYPGIPWRQLIQWGAFSGPAIVMTSFFYFMMEARLTLSVASAIVQCYFLLIFALSYFLLGEKITLIKVVASIVCVAGLTMTAISGLDGGEASHLICCKYSGYLFMIGSMIISASYQVAWAYIMNPIKAPFGRALSLGFMGIASCGCSTLVVMWIGIIIGNYSGWEPFELPPVGRPLDGIVLTASMDFVLNLSNLIAIGFINPTFVTVGGLLLIPLNVLSQFVFYGSLPSALEWVGVAVIIVGSILFETGDIVYQRYAAKHSKKNVRFLTEDDEELKQETEKLISSSSTIN